MDLTKILIETSERRVSKAPSRSALSLLKQELSGSQSEAMAIDSLLEEALSNNGLNPFDKNLISLVREYNCKDISGDLRRKIRNLLEKIKAGEDSPFHLMMLRITLRSKRKQLEKQQGSPPGTPASSDDEYEESDEFDPEHVFSNKNEEEDEDNPEDDSSNHIFERCLVSTSASLSSDSEDDEDVSPVSFINEATEQHPNSYFTDQTRKSCIISPINKEKILKAERNISHVAKAPKPFEKIVKADQVIVLDDEALQNNLKNHKNIQKIKEQNLVDPRVLEDLSMVTKRGPAIPAINNKQNRSAFKSYTTKEKMLKVDSNMVHVAKTPKSFEKNIKADQVTVTEDKALKSKLKKNKIQQNNKEKNLVDPRVKEDSSLVTIGPVIPAANIPAPHPEQAAAEVFEESQGANASQKVIPEVLSTEHDYGKEEKDKMRDDKKEYRCRSADLQQHKFNRSYSNNEEFLSINCYGGGKKKSKDSDLEYDPGDAKKRKAQKRNRRKNRRNNPRNNPNRPKGDARSSKRKAAVKAANAKTNPIYNPVNNPIYNPKRSKGDDRSLQQKAVVQAANAKTNADRPKGDHRSLQRKDAVKEANAKTNPINNRKRPRKQLHEYDENSTYPPTSKQVKDAGIFPSNAKAAACALQPPDPTRTMMFMNELIQEVRAKPILTFASQKFWNSAISVDDESYLELERQTIEMLQSLKLFLTFDILDDDFEKYDCNAPLPHEYLMKKTEDQTELKVRKEWITELLLYEGCVKEISSIRASKTENKAEAFDKVISKWKETLRVTTFCGFNDVKRFYKLYEEYQKFKYVGCKICTVCGCRRRTPAGKLKDAVHFLHLLELNEEEVKSFEGLLTSENDCIGKRAQRCFHIEKVDDKHYFILDLDEDKYYGQKGSGEKKHYSLVKDGKVSKLPVCDTCFTKLKRRNTWATKHPDIKLDNNSGPSLPDFAFKNRDFGRIPESLSTLNQVGRTSIAPFSAFTRVRQVRNSSGIPGAAQSASKGHSLSRLSREISAKDFYIPLTDEEFSNSFTRELPRDDIASLHRLFFMGNLSRWNSMESRLNAQNQGLTFDAQKSIDWIETLKRTKVFDEGFHLRRASAIEKIQRRVNQELITVTDMNASTGVVVDDSEMIERMAKANEDDVARARQTVDDHGEVSSVPGITSCLYTKSNESQGKMPILKAVLNKTKKKSPIDTLDNLILTLDKDLPNEFGDFPQITQMTFPDLFPIPVNEYTFMGTSMMNKDVRRHLLDYYDGRFCDTKFIFWMFNILTRHSEIKNCSTFFKHKHRTQARMKFEELCNMENLEQRLEYALKNEDSEDAKNLTKAFHELISVVGGQTPWTTGERQRTLGKLYAMTNFFGMPSFFITMAPCIADSRICIELLNNTKCVYDYELSTHEQRCRWTAANPVASAKAFHIIVQALVSTFLNVPLSKKKRSTPLDTLDVDNKDSKKSDTEEHDCESIEDTFKRHLRSKLGCLGVPVAFYGIFEPQARMALHVHALFWTLLNAELLSKCTQKDLRRICLLIDQLIATWINESDVIKEQEFKKKHKSVRIAHRKIPPGLSWDEVGSLAKRIMFRCQLHDRCTFTCFKRRGGKQKCGLGLPKAKIPSTKFSKLIPQRNSAGDMIIPFKDENIDPPVQETPIPAKGTQVLWCDHKRVTDTDANLVEGNITISATFAWNTSINYISTPGSAQSALFYVGNYMRKPIDKKSAILPMVTSARKKQLRFPSRAEDQGSSKRNAKYLTQILLNKINGSQEISDQIAASAVYGYDSYISSHDFVNFYPVDLYNYIKYGGESIGDDLSKLNPEDMPDENAEKSEDEDVVIPQIGEASGNGQAIQPNIVKSREEKGQVIVPVVKDIDDYIYRDLTSPLANFSPFHYKMAVSRVPLSELNKRSSKERPSGPRRHATFPFHNGHPLAQTHMQRLRGKFSIPQFIGMQIPKHPGPEPDDKSTSEYAKWKRKLTKLTNFIQAVYLPWSKDVEKFRPPLDVIAELETYMTKNLAMDQRNEVIEDETDVEECEQKEHMPRNIGSYINSHIRRTIGFALSAPDVKHDTKKMIQLLRHEFSRKRQKLFEGHNSTYDEEDSDILGEYAEVMCEAQADRLAPNKHKTRMEKHLDDVFNSLERLRDDDQKGFIESKDEYKKFTLEDARQLKNDVDKKIQDLADSKDSDDEEAEDDEAVYNMKYLGCIRVNEEAFYEDMSDDQKDAGRYLLTKLSKLPDNSQLLMLLHGSPGTGKSFLIKRVKNCTDVKMQITATSGICAMSLNGSTIDWLLDKGYRNKNNEEQRTLYTRVENMRGKIGDTTLLVIDEVSMMGCKKLNELDKMLKMVKNNELVFGGLDVLLVGDFAQLPAVKQVSLHDALVQSTQHYIAPKEDVMQAATLLARFRKFELTTLHRSEGCMKLKELLIRYRSIENSTSSITMDEIKEIGLLDKEVLTKNTKFKDAVMLVTTRREKSELSKKIGQRWAKDKGVPFYWWYKRPSKGGMSNEEADLISQGMYKYCPDVEGYYIQGAPCMMKRNISPPLGYANGSQGKMIGIVPKEGNVLPAGAPGEMIMIEPPEYIIMEVSHKKDKQQWTTIVPCKLEKVTFDYRRDGKDKKFYCMSNSVNLKFAFTIHETQGQTLEKVLLLLGRKPGLHVGSITWSLLYVALSRARELQDIKFFPCGWSGFSNFKHLTRLKPSSIFVKWNSGYRDNVWRSDILENQNRRNEMCVENKLVRQGPAISLDKTKDILIGYLLGLGYKVLKRTHRKVLQTGVMDHMERKKLWKLGEDKAKFLSERGSRKRKKSQVKKIVQRKSRKLSDGKKSESVNLSQKSSSVKAKRKLSKKKRPANKKKSKKKVEVEEILPERFLYPDDLIFEKLLFDRKGYRIDPIKRDGNCLFRAIAGAVKGNTELYADVRKQCADFMEKEKKYFTPFLEVVKHRVLIKSVDDHISILRQDTEWGGDPEIIALSGVFNCFFEVYKFSNEHPEIPDVRHFPNVIRDTNPTIRLYYSKNHYSIVRSDEVGDQLFNFEGLQDDELKRQKKILFEANNPKKSIQSKQNLSLDDDEALAHAKKLSIAAAEAEKNYLRFYASRIIKRNTTEQN